MTTALVIGQPMTNEVDWSRVSSDTSDTQSDSQTSERGIWEREKNSFTFTAGSREKYLSGLISKG